MKTFDASLAWERGAQPFSDQRYSRAHTWQFDGGLAVPAARALVVDSYRDRATGFLDMDERGQLSMTRIVLRPRIVFAGGPPDADLLARLHHDAHARCYIASSLRGEVVVEGEA
jgi:organic hydroperoxide reductase OsmC/OhrA